MKYTLLTLLIFIRSHALHSQDAQEELGIWYKLGINSRLTEKLTIGAQSQLRLYELADEQQQIKFRTGITYTLNPKIKFVLGYAYFETDPSYLVDTPSSFIEQRIYEDVIVKNNLQKLGISHRYRIEHRFFNFPGNSNRTTHWMRYQITFSYPLTKRLKADIYDEIFINLQEPLFGQNWIGGGLTYALSDMISARGGYFRINARQMLILIDCFWE